MEFPDALLHIVDMESILDEKEVRSRYTRVTVRTGHNYRSDLWIGIKILVEFPDARFHIVDVESLLVDEEVWSHQARVTGRIGHNF